MTGLREKKKEQTRRRIAQSAVELMATSSSDQVTIAAIAEHAEVSARTFHNYFPTREAALFYFLHIVVDRWVENIRNSPADLGPIDIMHRLIEDSTSMEPGHPYSFASLAHVIDHINFFTDCEDQTKAYETVKRISDAICERCPESVAEIDIHAMVNLAIAGGAIALKMTSIGPREEILAACFNIIRDGFSS